MKENTERVGGAKQGWNWKESHAVFIAMPVLCIVLVPLGTLTYLFGRMGWPWPIAACVIFPAIGISIIYCFFVSLVKLIADWARCTGRERALFSIEVCLPIVFVGSFIIQGTEPVRLRLWPDAGPYTYGLRDRVIEKADISAIRDWLKTVDEDDYSQPSEYLPPEKWPGSFKQLKPRGVYVSAYENGNAQIKIALGGGFIRCGVVIATEDMVIPDSELDSRYESWLPVVPGVYVYDY